MATLGHPYYYKGYFLPSEFDEYVIPYVFGETNNNWLMNCARYSKSDCF